VDHARAENHRAGKNGFARRGLGTARRHAGKFL